MYFRNYRLPKAWLGKSLKHPVSEQQKVPSTAEICNTALLSYSWLVGWKMLLLLLSETLGLFLNTMTADDKYSLWNSENLPKPIKMQLYR